MNISCRRAAGKRCEWETAADILREKISVSTKGLKTVEKSDVVFPTHQNTVFAQLSAIHIFYKMTLLYKTPMSETDSHIQGRA